MKFTQAGLAVIKTGEGCKLAAYQDSVGVWTIGYGHTGPEIVAGLTWTQQQAEDVLAQQLEHFVSATQHVVTNTRISDNQFSALVSLHYNIGLRNLVTSTALRETNAGNLPAVPPAFLLYDKGHDRATGQMISLPGLRNRRQSEIKLWNTPDSAAPPQGPATPLPTPPAPLPVPCGMATAGPMFGCFNTS